MRNFDNTGRLAIVVPVAAVLMASLLAGCGNNKTDETAPPPTTNTAPVPTSSTMDNNAPNTTPGAAPGGPGGTMMNKPSMNPNGATGDAVITGKVKSAIIADSKVGATDLNVDTKSGTVVLKGSVKSQAAKDAAMADAKKMEGVHNVIDQLKIAP